MAEKADGDETMSDDFDSQAVWAYVYKVQRDERTGEPEPAVSVPGLRLGYLAICPTMPAEARATLSATAEKTQLAMGCAFPDSILQYAVKDLETVSIDVAAYQRKRDRLYDALTQWGYAMTQPAGTFYLWGKAPGNDAAAFAAAMAKRGVFIMPGTLFERPGDFRISLTGTEAMIEASLPAFQALAPAA